MGRGTSVWTPVPGQAAWQGGRGPLAAGFAQQPGASGHDLSCPSPGVQAPRGPSFRPLWAAVPAPLWSRGVHLLNGGRAHGAHRASWSLTPRLSLASPPRGCRGCRGAGGGLFAEGIDVLLKSRPKKNSFAIPFSPSQPAGVGLRRGQRSSGPAPPWRLSTRGLTSGTCSSRGGGCPTAEVWCGPWRGPWAPGQLPHLVLCSALLNLSICPSVCEAHGCGACLDLPSWL